MRSPVLPLLVLSLATPAIAAESKTQRDVEQAADTLNSPVTQAVASAAVGAMTAAVLDIRIDGLSKALEPLNGGKPVKMHARTVRDLAAREDPDFERKMQSNTRAAVGSMGSLASAMAVMLPQLEEAARKMKDALPKMH